MVFTEAKWLTFVACFMRKCERSNYDLKPDSFNGTLGYCLISSFPYIERIMN